MYKIKDNVYLRTGNWKRMVNFQTAGGQIKVMLPLMISRLTSSQNCVGTEMVNHPEKAKSMLILALLDKCPRGLPIVLISA